MTFADSVGTLLIVILALGLAALPGRGRAPDDGQDHRYATLDGLRGLLAVFVMLSHASAWHKAAQHRGWGADGRVFMHFGQGSVALFFMITAFLFVGRVVDSGKAHPIDWPRLYVSRVLRLTPLYWLAMCAMFGVLAFVTWQHIDGAGDGIVQREWSDILPAAGIWLGFCMLGEPAIDAYLNTPLIVAGVVWSMPFEWTFYLLLPIVALLLRKPLPTWALGLGLAGLLWVGLWQGQPAAIVATPFLGGLVAVAAARSARVRAWACSTAGACVAIASLAALVTLCDAPFGVAPLLLQTIAFCVIASGNDLFGLLTSRAARTLGALSYGVYLFHGIVLYLTFMVIVGMPRATTFAPWLHWCVVAVALTVLLGLAHVAHRRVELPAMRAVGPLMARLRARRERRRQDAAG